MRSFIVYCYYPDLIHTPNNIYVSYLIAANNPRHAATRAKLLAIPSIKSMLHKLAVEPHTINYIAEELLIIENVVEDFNRR